MPSKPKYEELNKRIRELEQAELERKHAEEALTKAKEQYQELAESISDLFYAIDKDLRFTYWNKACERITGIPAENAIGKSLMELFPDNDAREHLKRMYLRVIETKKPEQSKTNYPGNEKIIHEINVYPTMEGVSVFVKDITERERIEKALKDNEKKYRLLFEDSDALISVYDRNGICLLLNRKVAKLFGGEPGDFIGKPFNKLHPDKGEEYARRVREVIDSGITKEYEDLVEFPNGDRWLFSKVHPIRDAYENIISAQIISQDITIRKQAEELLRNSEANLRFLTENMEDIIWLTDLDFRIKYISPSVEKVLGFTQEERTKQILEEMVTHESAKAIRDRFNKELLRENAISEPDRVFTVEVEYYKKDGSTIWLENKVKWISDTDGNIKGIHGVSRDISERKKAEEVSERLRTQLANAIEMAKLGAWEYDIVNNIFTFNDQFYNILRTTASEMGGYTMSYSEYANRFFHPNDILHAKEELEEVSMDANMESSRHGEHRVIFADGTEGWVSVQYFIVRDKNGKPIKNYGVTQDITTRKKMEEEILKVQKLESVGMLAGGIAHDFNNALTVILGNIEMAMLLGDQGDELFEVLTEAKDASIKAQAITRQLLTFAKGGAPVRENTSIQNIIKESCLFALRGSKNECEFYFEKDLWAVNVDTGQITQVFNNIVMNASQAMPEGGKINISAENINVKNGHGLSVKSGKHIRITIKDQGVGISNKYLTKIFDPYFTTKQEGSGMGLATSYSIIEKHNGYIDVESKIGEGTTFHIYLPASDESILEKEADQQEMVQGRILVMDDEASLKKMLGRMLSKLGYDAEFASEGAEALKMYETSLAYGKRYDAVILDLTIPGGMGGQETIKKLIDMDSEVKAIVSSGYSEDPVMANYQEYGFKGIMPKPFESSLVNEVLRAVIKSEAM